MHHHKTSWIIADQEIAWFVLDFQRLIHVPLSSSSQLSPGHYQPDLAQ